MIIFYSNESFLLESFLPPKRRATEKGWVQNRPSILIWVKSSRLDRTPLYTLPVLGCTLDVEDDLSEEAEAWLTRDFLEVAVDRVNVEMELEGWKWNRRLFITCGRFSCINHLITVVLNSKQKIARMMYLSIDTVVSVHISSTWELKANFCELKK